MSDNDDQTIGRLLDRREVLAIFGKAGFLFLAACSPAASTIIQPTSTSAPAPTLMPTTGAATPPPVVAVPSCIVRPALTEGPYFVDEKLNRSDIRPDPAKGTVSEGVPLKLTFNVARISGSSCTAFPNAYVDIWHCDALGVYSDVQGSTGTKFLRGYQMTDANGKAEFLTVYPGWYPGRAVHIHFKVRTDINTRGFDFTSQLFFDDAVSDQVFTLAPYSQKRARDTRNTNDGIYRDGGSQLVPTLTKDGQGYAGTFAIGLQV